MRIGHEIGLDEHLLDDLYHALLLKDVGCSSNSSRLHQIVGDDEIKAKSLTKTLDWTPLRVETDAVSSKARSLAAQRHKAA